MPTTAERLHQSVIAHGITWGDLSKRVQNNEGVSEDKANAQVDLLLRADACTLPVAVALIDLIVAKQKT